MATVFIKSSKTDPFRQGVIVRLAVLNHPLCPVKALFRYIAIRGAEQGPLFIYSNGAFLTRIHLADLLCRSLPFVPNVNTHSFRRGGASALAAAGTPEHVIQISPNSPNNVKDSEIVKIGHLNINFYQFSEQFGSET